MASNPLQPGVFVLRVRRGVAAAGGEDGTSFLAGDAFLVGDVGFDGGKPRVRFGVASRTSVVVGRVHGGQPAPGKRGVN